MGPLVGVSILCILSSLAFILLKKKMLVALLYVVAVSVLCLFLVEPWVGFTVCECGISWTYSLTLNSTICREHFNSNTNLLVIFIAFQ